MAYPRKIQVGENIRIADNAEQERRLLEEAEKLKKNVQKESVTLESLLDRIDELEIRIIDLEEKVNSENEAESKKRGRKPKDTTTGE